MSKQDQSWLDQQDIFDTQVLRKGALGSVRLSDIVCHVREDERRKAVEECCRAACFSCQKLLPVQREWSIWIHWLEEKNAYSVCGASAIREHFHTKPPAEKEANKP